jgi:hypothetical protein
MLGEGEVGRAGKWDELQQWGGGLPPRKKNKGDNWRGHPTVNSKEKKRRETKAATGLFLEGELERKVVEIPNGGVLQ